MKCARPGTLFAPIPKALEVADVWPWQGILRGSVAVAFLAGASSCSAFQPSPLPGPGHALPPFSARMKGMTEAAYTPGVLKSTAVTKSIAHLHHDGVNWLSIQAAWFQKDNASTVIAPDPKKTPTDNSVTYLVKLAHHDGMRVFLDPFVNSQEGSGWQARFDPRSPSAWFRSFDHYLVHYAKLAQKDHVDMLAIGDEFDSLDDVPSYEPDWAHAIEVARHYYRGPITYGADFTHYQKVTFWKQLDDVGVDAYFPLSQSAGPTTGQLTSSWNRLANGIQAWRRSAGLTQKPFVITELGYPSEDGATVAPGSWYPNQPVNLTIQEKCYLATFQSIWQRPWLKGIMWFWWANPSNPHWQGGTHDNGYTLRDKPVEKTLKHYFQGSHGARETQSHIKRG